MRAGSEFLGTVIGAGLLGFGIDHFFETQPWGILLLLVIGFVSATWRAQKEMNKKD